MKGNVEVLHVFGPGQRLLRNRICYLTGSAAAGAEVGVGAGAGACQISTEGETSSSSSRSLFPRSSVSLGLAEQQWSGLTRW